MRSLMDIAAAGLIRVRAKWPTYTHNGRHGIDRNGNAVAIWDHKKHLKGAKVYPYSSTRQNTRQHRKGDRDMLTAMSS